MGRILFLGSFKQNLDEWLAFYPGFCVYQATKSLDPVFCFSVPRRRVKYSNAVHFMISSFNVKIKQWVPFRDHLEFNDVYFVGCPRCLFSLFEGNYSTHDQQNEVLTFYPSKTNTGTGRFSMLRVCVYLLSVTHCKDINRPGGSEWRFFSLVGGHLTFERVS